VFSNPNSATAIDTHFSEVYGLLLDEKKKRLRPPLPQHAPQTAIGRLPDRKFRKGGPENVAVAFTRDYG
jgi:hypothetical protein